MSSSCLGLYVINLLSISAYKNCCELLDPKSRVSRITIDTIDNYGHVNRSYLRPVYSDTTRRRVELSCVGEVYSDTTQLDWPALRWLAVRCNWVSCIADRRRQLSCVGEGVYRDAIELNSTSSWVELSCVAINGPLLTYTKNHWSSTYQPLSKRPVAC